MTGRRTPVRLLASRLLLSLAVVSLAFAAVVGVSWMRDRQRLRAVAQAVTAPARSDDERLTRLLHWVYANHGFEKNRRYFIWKKLDATPIQVLEHGGDCEDKSKLLVTMLRELGIKGSLAMLYPCPACLPSHVVTLVDTPSGTTPMDAVYDLAFPAGQGGFIDIAAIKADASLLPRRLDTLVAERGADDKIALYKRGTEHFRYVTTINWDKNFVTRGAASIIRAAGGEPWRTPRPLFLDDPKQFFVLAGLAVALGSTALGLWTRRRAR